MTLRQGITFHDGTPFDATAVRASFQAQFDSPLIGFGPRPFYPAENATKVIDEFTIQYNLLDPALNQAPVGTGPFKIESRTLDSVTRVVRNDNWRAVTCTSTRSSSYQSRILTPVPTC